MGEVTVAIRVTREILMMGYSVSCDVYISWDNII